MHIAILLYVLILGYTSDGVYGQNPPVRPRAAIKERHVVKRDTSWVTLYRRDTASAAASPSDGSCNDLITCADSSCKGPGDDPIKNPKCANGCPCIYLVVPTQGSQTIPPEDTVETMAAGVVQAELKASYSIPTIPPSSSWGSLPTLPTMIQSSMGSDVVGFWQGTATMPPDADETDTCDLDSEDDDDDDETNPSSSSVVAR